MHRYFRALVSLFSEFALKRSVPVQFALAQEKTLFKLRLTPGSYRFGTMIDADYVLPAHMAGEEFTIDVHSSKRVSVAEAGDALRIRNPGLKPGVRKRNLTLRLGNGTLKAGRPRSMYPIAAGIIALVMMTGMNTNNRIVAAAISEDGPGITSAKPILKEVISPLSEREIISRNLTRKLQGVGLPYAAKVDENQDVIVSGEANEKSRQIAESILKSAIAPGGKIVFLQGKEIPVQDRQPATSVQIDEPESQKIRFVQVKPKALVILENEMRMTVGSIDPNGWMVETIGLDEITFSKSGKTFSRKF